MKFGLMGQSSIKSNSYTGHSIWCLAFGAAFLSVSPHLAWGTELEIAWLDSQGKPHEIEKLDPAGLKQFRSARSTEKDPRTSKTVEWRGVLFSTLLESVVKKMPPEDRAKIDLVILKGKTGELAAVPRSLLIKYKVLLANQSSDAEYWESKGFGPYASVIPWTSQPRILIEDLPLETFFIANLVRIELTNYRDRFPQFFLKRRTDPSAMRGEKLFVNTCISCHSSGHGPEMLQPPQVSVVDRLKSLGHPAENQLKMSKKDWKFISRYLSAFQLENKTVQQAPTGKKALHSSVLPWNVPKPADSNLF